MPVLRVALSLLLCERARLEHSRRPEREAPSYPREADLRARDEAHEWPRRLDAPAALLCPPWSNRKACVVACVQVVVPVRMYCSLLAAQLGQQLKLRLTSVSYTHLTLPTNREV